MSKLQKFKASKPFPDYKARRQAKELLRHVEELDKDIAIVEAYMCMEARAARHNVAAGVYAPQGEIFIH